MFTYLTTDEKTKRVMHFWKRCILKLRGSTVLVHKLRDLRIKVHLQGRHNVVKKWKDASAIVDQQQNTCLIMPANKFRRYWNVYIGFLLIYTSLFVPLRIAFYDEQSTEMLVFESLIDLCFFIDIILNFFSAFEKKNNVVETRHRQIAISYFKGWFWIDFISTVPFQLVEELIKSESSTREIKLAKVTRLPRLYRIVRILRLIKLARLSKRGGFLAQVQELLQLTSSTSNMVGLLLTVLFLTHLVACIFFLQSKLMDFPDDSWVIQEDVMDKEVFFQYTIAFYWALQTLTTVGFGDITIVSVEERIFAIMWMIIGIAFYSYAIGNMTNFIDNMDADREQLNQKLAVLKEFRSRTQMPINMYSKIKRHLENNQKSANSF